MGNLLGSLSRLSSKLRNAYRFSMPPLLSNRCGRCPAIASSHLAVGVVVNTQSGLIAGGESALGGLLAKQVPPGSRSLTTTNFG